MVASQRRRRAIAMTAAELDLFLGGQRTCRFATVGPGGPHVSPVWFVWDGGALWVYSLTRSQRWADLQRDPRVAVVIDEGHHYHELHGVEIEGEAVVVGPVPRTGDADDADEQTQGVAELADPERLMARKYFGSAQMTHDGRHAWLRVTPTKITSWDFRKLASLPAIRARPIPDAPPPAGPLPWICTGPYGRRELE
jgi:Pyridoxamine 5'-phosphate oxidase